MNNSKVKLSVILPTNKKNSKEKLDEIKKVCSVREHWAPEPIFNWDFTTPLDDWVYGMEHILEPTLSCLFEQVFDDYEVLLCHKYPEDVDDLIDIYDGFNLRVIKEKPSIWHELGDEYPTVNNIRNTGIIEAKGELLLFLDDYSIFDPYLLQRAWDEYKNGYYITARGTRRIRYAPDMDTSNNDRRKVLMDKGVYGARNFIDVKNIGLIPNYATWTYCCTVSLEECLKIGAFDELYDGNFGGTDQDFGRRLAMISNMKRKLAGDIYEFAHKSLRQRVRDDEVFRQVIGQFPIPKHVRANSWKPTQQQMDKYEKWHLNMYGNINENWNRCMQVPIYNLEDKRK